jgi:hypothetical protein
MKRLDIVYGHEWQGTGDRGVMRRAKVGIMRRIEVGSEVNNVESGILVACM